MEATLELAFTRGPSATLFRCARQDPPWKVVRGFTLDSGQSLVHLNNVSGGIFGGDSLHLRTSVGDGAEAQITTTGATRIYRPRSLAADARLSAEFRLRRDALLEYLPDALIPFRNARVSQHTQYSLAEGATLFCWETIAPGRTAAGEIFHYEQLKLVSEIEVGGCPVLNDRLLLEPARWPMTTPARFGSYRYLVTFVAVRAGSSAAEVRSLEECLEAVAYGPAFQSAAEAEELWGVTTLPAHGVLVRGMTTSALAIPGRLFALWSAARQHVCGRVAVMPRKTY
jgi:urease accessory protein